jgi:hypothetical protein
VGYTQDKKLGNLVIDVIKGMDSKGRVGR